MARIRRWARRNAPTAPSLQPLAPPVDDIAGDDDPDVDARELERVATGGAVIRGRGLT